MQTITDHLQGVSRAEYVPVYFAATPLTASHANQQKKPGAETSISVIPLSKKNPLLINPGEAVEGMLAQKQNDIEILIWIQNCCQSRTDSVDLTNNANEHLNDDRFESVCPLACYIKTAKHLINNNDSVGELYKIYIKNCMNQCSFPWL